MTDTFECDNARLGRAGPVVGFWFVNYGDFGPALREQFWQFALLQFLCKSRPATGLIQQLMMTFPRFSTGFPDFAQDIHRNSIPAS
jgi:hypothetical protein